MSTENGPTEYKFTGLNVPGMDPIKKTSLIDEPQRPFTILIKKSELLEIELAKLPQIRPPGPVFKLPDELPCRNMSIEEEINTFKQVKDDVRTFDFEGKKNYNK